jgi:hypothetical protein
MSYGPPPVGSGVPSTRCTPEQAPTDIVEAEFRTGYRPWGQDTLGNAVTSSTRPLMDAAGGLHPPQSGPPQIQPSFFGTSQPPPASDRNADTKAAPCQCAASGGSRPVRNPEAEQIGGTSRLGSEKGKYPVNVATRQDFLARPQTDPVQMALVQQTVMEMEERWRASEAATEPLRVPQELPSPAWTAFTALREDAMPPPCYDTCDDVPEVPQHRVQEVLGTSSLPVTSWVPSQVPGAAENAPRETAMRLGMGTLPSLRASAQDKTGNPGQGMGYPGAWGNFSSQPTAGSGGGLQAAGEGASEGRLPVAPEFAAVDTQTSDQAARSMLGDARRGEQTRGNKGYFRSLIHAQIRAGSYAYPLAPSPRALSHTLASLLQPPPDPAFKKPRGPPSTQAQVSGAEYDFSRLSVAAHLTVVESKFTRVVCWPSPRQYCSYHL